MTEPVPQYQPPSAGVPARTVSRQPSWITRPAVGWVFAALPILSFGLLTFVPLLRCGLIRPARQRWALIGAGIGLEAVGVAAMMTVSSAPENAQGDPTGVAGALGTTVWLIAMTVTVVLAVVFRDPIRANINTLPADVLAKRAGIDPEEADQIAAQRRILGRFDSVEHAIEAADLSEEAATRLREVGVV
ncbi:MAG TPA: hypothetical protein VJ872_16385 [Nocardioides sp.]|nr:hypothetical protein [Nocardioides sp.]